MRNKHYTIEMLTNGREKCLATYSTKREALTALHKFVPETIQAVDVHFLTVSVYMYEYGNCYSVDHRVFEFRPTLKKYVEIL